MPRTRAAHISYFKTKSGRFKGTGHPKISILSSFTHPSCYEQLTSQLTGSPNIPPVTLLERSYSVYNVIYASFMERLVKLF